MKNKVLHKWTSHCILCSCSLICIHLTSKSDGDLTLFDLFSVFGLKQGEPSNLRLFLKSWFYKGDANICPKTFPMFVLYWFGRWAWLPLYPCKLPHFHIKDFIMLKDFYFSSNYFPLHYFQIHMKHLNISLLG